MIPTIRDTADFYRLALDNSTPTRGLVQLAAVVDWADTMILASDVPDDWMLELSLAKTPDVASFALLRTPPPATPYLGASIVVSHIGRRWRAETIARDDACYLLRKLRDELRPEHQIAALIPSAALEDADACLAQGEQDPQPYTRVDEALTEIFGHYDSYQSLIPNTTDRRADDSD